jgi:hypothetical protein
MLNFEFDLVNWYCSAVNQRLAERLLTDAEEPETDRGDDWMVTSEVNSGEESGTESDLEESFDSGLQLETEGSGTGGSSEESQRGDKRSV